MPRAATTSDPFNAIADANRRRILTAIGDGEASVGELVAQVGMPQPHVSKHLGVLRTVDLVRSRSDGRRRYYRVNGAALRTVHEWVAGFERTWNDRLDRLDGVLAELQDGGSP